MEKIFLLKGLDCPHCAGKIEQEVGALAGVRSSQMNLMKQMLTVQAEDAAGDTLFAQVEEIVHSHEPDVRVSLYTPQTKEKSDANKENIEARQMIRRLVIGGALFAAGLLAGGIFPLSLALLVGAYGILAWDILFRAARNIVKGRVFDENFLMALASVGAFAIGEYHEAVAVILFYQVGEFFQALSVRRSRRSIAALMDIRPDHASVLRHGLPLTVPAESVAVGEQILVRPGERIPLDGIVLQGQSTLDTSALTGESLPRSVSVGDTVLSGCINQTGVLTIRVTKVFGESTASKILHLVENAASRKAPAENFITAFARWYTPVVVILATLLAVLPPLALGGGWGEWLRRGLVFLVVSCPCALVISIPLTFFGGVGAASRHGVLVKGSNYLEALAKVRTMVFDKTGTLTKGVFKVTEVLPDAGVSESQVLEYAAVAEQFSGHPIAKSILSAYGKTPVQENMENYREVSGKGILVTVAGKTLAVGNATLMETEGIPFVPCAKVGTKVYVAAAGKYMGCIVIADEIKPDSAHTMAQLNAMGVEKRVMLTGDEDAVAKEVAQALGMDTYHARLLPQEKLTLLEQLDGQKPAGTKLAFVGDGINDAPVLARADVGIAMGALGADAAIEAADVVLMTDEPGRLLDAIRIAKATKQIVVQNIVLALGLKGIILLLGALGIAGMWAAVFADVGVAMLAVLNAMRILKK